MVKRWFEVILVVFLALSTCQGCAGRKKIREGKQKAIDELSALNTATSVGVSYADYGKRCTDMMIAIEKVSRDKPPGSSEHFWSYIALAVDDYQFALNVWAKKFTSWGCANSGEEITLYYDEDLLKQTLQRYPALEGAVISRKWTDNSGRVIKRLSVDVIIQEAWASASKHIKSAEAKL